MKKFTEIILKTIFVLVGSICVLAGLGLAYCVINDVNLDDFNLDKLVSSDDVDDVKDWYLQELGNVAVGKPVKVEGISYDKYAYQHISEDTQAVYDQIYDCICSYKEGVVVSTKDDDVIAVAYEAVFADYGDIFWVSGYQINTYQKGDEIVSLEFLPTYTMTEEQKNVYQVTIDSVTTEWLAGISQDATDYEKALYVFETLIEKVDYDANSKENQNILSTFLYNSTVCQGYADGAWYLLDKLGIKSAIVTGNANNEAHAWNLVYLDGAYYYMDVTWGNSKYKDTDSSTKKRINYAYLAMDSEELLRSHEITSHFDMPDCLSNQDNYFVREGLYYESFDADAIGNAFATSYNAGKEEISLKFATEELYNEVIDYFFNKQNISKYCKIKSVYYLMDNECKVITVQWNR